MRNRVYYNEHDLAACGWLRELMDKGLIPEGDIDERSIEDVRPDDLRRYTQCHFFAGIGGWPLALRLAGAQDLECWTGSCPCQPFSAAGQKKGTDDERHLWPVWEPLIRECRPPVVLGEQVEAAVAHGWLDLVSSGLEAAGYAFGAVAMGAHSVGAFHIRQRLYWGGVLGDAQHDGPPEIRELGGTEGAGRLREPEGPSDPLGRGASRRLGDAHGGRQGREGRRRPEGQAGQPSAAGGMADPDCGGLEGSSACSGEGRGSDALREGALGGFWSECDWLPCRDGKARPTEPGTFPLADGVSQRVVLLSGYGNAVVPQVAAEFVKALIG